MVTFQVDEVTPAARMLPTRPLGLRFPEALVMGGDPDLPVVEHDGIHPLLGAVGRAFAEHRPLTLSPDAVWLTIMQGVAHHVRLNAEELRPRLVKHPGRKRLTVEVDGPMPHDPASWQQMVELFEKLLLGEIGRTDGFECDFSTTTEVEKMAGRIVLLDAYSPYFALWIRFVCGIPSITLTGTVEDWQKIRDRVDRLASLGLETWCRSLAAITDQFVRAAGGDVDVDFWRRIYSPIDAYGGEVITGWAARLYPYLLAAGVVGWPNPLLDLPIGEPRNVTTDENMFYRGPGVRSDGVPATLSKVIVNINDQVDRENKVVALHAGLVGIAQDGDGRLQPVAGWHIEPAAVQMDDVIDRIVRDHATEPPRQLPPLFAAPADLVALYKRIGAASLFDGAWHLRAAEDRLKMWRGENLRSIHTLIDLPDGRSIAAALDATAQETHWIACRVTEKKDGRFRLADDPADVPVYGTSLALLLDAALDSGGDISHLETGRLDRLDALTPGAGGSGR